MRFTGLETRSGSRRHVGAAVFREVADALRNSTHAFVEYFSDQFMYRSGAQIIEDFVQVDGTGLPKV